MDFNFELHVKTSAKGKTGIHWRNIESEEDQCLEDTPNLINFEVLKDKNGQRFIVNDLIDEYKPSLLIFREEGKLLLEVSGIESPKRSQELGRKVLNLIVWIVDDLPDNEKIIRMIAYSAIQNFLHKDSSFSEMVEKSISFYQLEEFKVDIPGIHKFIDDLQTKYNQYFTNLKPNSESQIESKSDDYLHKLAEELQKYCLPKKWNSWNGEKSNGVLVVITDSLSKNTILHNVGVWRGFASNVEAPLKPVVQTLEKKTEIPAETPEIPPHTSQNNGLIILVIVGILVILVIIVSTTLQLQNQPQIEPTPQPQPQGIL
ncbi:hypothetical protein FJR11_20815, partial [Anabaena sp. UHCC 0187]|uniref:hypothetical protein n=1 Tax=Anabaena sp. UHCC 0187 TaxID=2590018 RepID=UPI001444F4F1